MLKHFEELWEECENQDSSQSHQDIFLELDLKIKLYSYCCNNNVKIDETEAKKAKFKIMGEMLLSLTKLSKLDNIDVYKALEECYKFNQEL